MHWLRRCRPRISAEQAIALARQEVEAWNAGSAGHPLAIDEFQVHELWWAWVVSVQSAEYMQSRDWRHMLLGLGPYLVDKFTGEVIGTGTGTLLHELERSRGYRAWWDVRGPRTIIEYVVQREASRR